MARASGEPPPATLRSATRGSETGTGLAREGSPRPLPPRGAAPAPPASGSSRRRGSLAPFAIASVGFVLLSWLLFTVMGSAPPGIPWPHTPPSSGTPAGPPALKIQHVVVIVLENREVGDVWALAPYERYLQGHYANATHFFALCHGSPPNYIAMTSGRAEYCGANLTGQVNAENLPDVVEHAGLTWDGYFESMPSACYTYSQGTYVAWHNPFIAYDDILDNPSRCAAHVLPSAQFNESVANGTLPTVSFYIPNSIDDCDYAALSVCDPWLDDFLTPILNATSPPEQALVNHTAFFIVYDEGSTDAGYASPLITPDCLNTTGRALTTCGGQVYFTIVSPYSVGTFYSSDATSFNIESTIEWLFGLPSDGGYDGSSDFPPMTSLFGFASNSA